MENLNRAGERGLDSGDLSGEEKTLGEPVHKLDVDICGFRGDIGRNDGGFPRRNRHETDRPRPADTEG